MIYHGLWLGGIAAWLLGSQLLATRAGLPARRVAFALGAIALATWLGAGLHAQLLEVRSGIAGILGDPAELVLGSGRRLPGGLLLGMLTGLWVSRRLRFPRFELADAVAPFAGVAIALGRLGCLYEGCCHGKLSSLPWAISFGSSSPAWRAQLAQGLIPFGAERSLPVHPLQLYFVAAALLSTGMALAVRRRRRYPGQVFLVFFAVFGLSGALLEFLRDTRFEHVPMRQLLLALTGVWSALTLAIAWRRRR